MPSELTPPPDRPSSLHDADSPASPAAQYPDPIPGIIAFQSLTVFAGAPGVGKTALLADLCARWRDGRSIFGRAVAPPVGGFYYLAADRQWASHAIWFERVGFAEIPHYSLVDDRSVSLVDLQKAHQAHQLFDRCLDQLDPPPGAHVFVDPVSPLFINGNPNNPRDVARSMIGFSRRCSERRINITVVGHFSKQGKAEDRYTRPQDRISGSGAFVGFSDTQMYMCDPEKDAKLKQPYHLFGWVPRHAPPEDFKLTRNELGLFVPYQGSETEERTAPAAEPVSDGGRAGAQDRLILELFTQPTETRASLSEHLVEQGLLLSPATLTRILDRLVKEHKIMRLGRGTYKRLLPS